MGRFAVALRRLRRRPGALTQAAALAVAFQVVRVGAAPVAAAALALEAPWALLLLYMPIVLFLMMLPISLGGLGVREAALVYFLASGGHMAAESALALGLLLGLAALVVQSPGAVVCLTGLGTRARKRPGQAVADLAEAVRPAGREAG